MTTRRATAPNDKALNAFLAANLESQSPGILRKIADSIGMADDFGKWEGGHAA